VALADALARLPKEMPGAPAGFRPKPGQFNAGGEGFEPPALPARYDPAFYKPDAALVDQLAAVSVGVIDGEVRLDLDYKDDSAAHVDMNVAYTAGGRFVELQGSAEKLGGFDRATMDHMLDLAVKGCGQLMALQRQALGNA
jgi:ribonuclease PH